LGSLWLGTLYKKQSYTINIAKEVRNNRWLPGHLLSGEMNPLSIKYLHDIAFTIDRSFEQQEMKIKKLINNIHYKPLHACL